MSVSEFDAPPAVIPYAVVGAVAVVAGGIVAAVTGPTGWDDGSWVAAFLVLVVGVGQIGLGAAQAASADVARRVVTAQIVAYNVGSALVLVATLAGSPAVVTLGGVVLVGALAGFLASARRSDSRSWVARVQMALLVVLLVSVPIGIALSWVRA